MRLERAFLSDQSTESSDSRPSTHPESPQRPEQYHKQAQCEEAANYYYQNLQSQKEQALKKEEINKMMLSVGTDKIREKSDSLYIVANRGPVEYELTEDGKLKIKSGAGGVSSALSSFKELPVDKWFSSPMSKGDRKAMNTRQVSSDYHFVPLKEKIYGNYYNEISNNILWFILHGMYNQGQHNISEIVCERFSSFFPRWSKTPAKIEKKWKDYTRANQTFAKIVHAEMKRNAKKKPIVMIHDYHFLQLPGMLRKLHPTIFLQHFIHVPWPEPEAWEKLPLKVVQDIYHGISCNNILGFHTEKDADNFLDGSAKYLPDAKIDFEKKTVRRQEHDMQVRVYPISISVKKVLDTVKNELDKHNTKKPEVIEEEKKRIQGLPEKIHKILRVDRIEPTKNILAGLQAYDLLLEKYPQWRGKVVFRCRFVPSREKVPIYKALREEIGDTIKKINDKYGNEKWTPIDAFFGHDYPGALAEMVSYDVLLVNPIKDGMNLVAKEGVVVNQNDGVLVLSQTAGAFHELKDGALPLVSPSNVKETAKALNKALTIPLKERKDRATKMKDVVECYDLTNWMLGQLKDINSLLRSHDFTKR